MSLFETRAELAALLAPAGVTVHDHVPETIQTPCMVVAPGDDYLRETADWSSEYVVTQYLYLFVELRENEGALRELDDLISGVMPLLDSWVIESVSAPDVYETGEWASYGIRLTVKNLTTIEGNNA